MLPTLAAVAGELQSGKTTAQGLAEQALARIADLRGRVQPASSALTPTASSLPQNTRIACARQAGHLLHLRAYRLR